MFNNIAYTPPTRSNLETANKNTDTLLQQPRSGMPRGTGRRGVNCPGPSPRDAACEEPWDVSVGGGNDE